MSIFLILWDALIVRDLAMVKTHAETKQSVNAADEASTPRRAAQMPQNVPTAPMGHTALRQRNALCGSEKNKCKRLKRNETSPSQRHGRLSPSRAICLAAALRARKWYLGLPPTSNGLRSAHLLSRKPSQCMCRLTLHGRLVKTSHNRCHSSPRLHRPSHVICILNQHTASNKQLSKNHLIIMAIQGWVNRGREQKPDRPKALAPCIVRLHALAGHRGTCLRPLHIFALLSFPLPFPSIPIPSRVSALLVLAGPEPGRQESFVYFLWPRVQLGGFICFFFD